MQGTAVTDRELLDAAAVCGHLLAEGSVHTLLAQHRSRLFPDAMFGDLFESGRGRPSVPGEVVATVLLLQALEGLSDRAACLRLQTDVGWKAAAGLALTDEAFHPTVLTLWRKSRSTARSDIFDPTSPTHPWLAFTADWCSVPASWKIHLLETIINALRSPDLYIAQYIKQEPSFGGVTVPFYYACLRHDFNWRNLHRIRHHFRYDIAGVWNGAIRYETDERLKQDLIALCNANQPGEFGAPDWNWKLSPHDVEVCKDVATYFKLGVSTVAFGSIHYNH